MGKLLYPSHTVRCIIAGPSECGKSVFLTNLILYFINEFDKIYIYSPSLHQVLHQKIIKGFSDYIPIDILPNIFNGEDFDRVIDEVVNNKGFRKSDIEIETFGKPEDLNIPQEYNDGGIIILDDLNEKQMNDPRV